MRTLRSLPLLAALGFAACASSASAATAPILAGPWGPYQEGYGHYKPSTIFNGGDPTGLVQHITWHSWGGEQAVGTGTAEYLTKNQIVADGHDERGAQVVLFHLGFCRGRRAYNAIEWFFPGHHQHFNARSYINPCTGKYIENGHTY